MTRHTPAFRPAVRPLPAAAAVVAALWAAPPAGAQLGDLFSRGVNAVREEVGAERTVSRTLKFDDVDLATLKARLARFGVDVPLSAGGRVTAALTVSFNLARPTDASSLRVDGTLSSPRLTLAPAAGDAANRPVILTRVKADLAAADGVLTLESLAFTLPRGQAAGRVRGSAAVPFADPGDATADLTVDALPLDLLWDRVAPGALAGGTGSLTLKASVPADRLSDPAAWDGTAAVRADGVTAAGRAVNDLRADLALKNNTVKLTKLDAVVAGQPVGGAASVGLAAPFPVKADVRSARFDLAQLPALLPDGPEIPGRGLLDLRVDAAGTLDPRAVTADGRVRGDDLEVDGIGVRSLAADFAAKYAGGGGAVRLTGLTLATDRGTLTGSAEVDLAAGTWAVRGGLAEAPVAEVCGVPAGVPAAADLARRPDRHGRGDGVGVPARWTRSP